MSTTVRSSVRSKSKRRKLEKSHESLSTLLETLAYDLIFEILLRLPDCRSSLQYSLVCKEWFDLISQPNFLPTFVHHHNQRRQISKSLPYTLVFRTTYLYTTGQTFFSSESSLLHEVSNYTNSNCITNSYLNFLPWSVTKLLATCEDIVLATNVTTGQLCVCNPLTKNWYEIPSPSHVTLDPIYGLVCGPQSCAKLQQGCNCKNVLKSREFKVVVMHDHQVFPYYDEKLRVTVYCSETGRWCNTRRLDLCLPDNKLRCNTKSVVAINGIMHWLFVCKDGKVKGVASFDPFKHEDDPKQGRFMELPADLHLGWRAFSHRTCIGNVSGRLRLSQGFKIKGVGYFLRIWELTSTSNTTSRTFYNENYVPRTMWALVHDVMVRRTKTDNMYVIAFHPGNGNVIFFLRDSNIFRYDIVEEKISNWGKLFVPDKMIQNKAMKESLHLRLTGFTIAHPPWPTKLPLPNPI